MSKYIDADKLKEMVNKQYSYCNGYTGTKKDVYREALLAVKSAIHCQSVSKADVERVIRCKDCQLAKESSDFDGWYFCKNNQMTHQPTHFCSYGKKERCIMNIGRFGMGIRHHKTKDFKFFYCPLSNGIGREEFHFFWWFGHKWYIALRSIEEEEYKI